MVSLSTARLSKLKNKNKTSSSKKRAQNEDSMKKWERFRVNKVKVIGDYVRAKNLQACIGKYYKHITLMQILQVLISRYETRKAEIELLEKKKHIVKRFERKIKKMIVGINNRGVNKPTSFGIRNMLLSRKIMTLLS